MLIHCIKKAFSKKNILYVLLFVSIFFAFQDISFAAETPNFETKTIDVMNTLLKIFGSLLGAITALVSIFLHPGWYNGQIFDLNIYLKDIWILMSNVVYFIFAFLLIFIAFMNIIGKEGAHQEYQLKSALPKFIVGVLIVPFTWFIVQFVLSISAILTVSMLALPFDTFKDYDFFTKMGSQKICVSYIIPLGESSSGSTNAGGANPPATGSKIEESIKCLGEEKSITDIVASINGAGDGKTSDSIFGIVSIYTYGILGLEGLDTLSKNNIASGVTKIAHISLKMLFDIIFVIAYCLLMIALFLALFTRGVWLWVYTMMSPLFGLIYFFGDPHDETLKKFKFSEFIALAMVPVYVAAALSFGLVFIMVAGDGMRKSSELPASENSILRCTLPPISVCTIEVGDFKFSISGSVGNTSNIFGGAFGALGTLIIQMFGLVILWLSVMAALHASKITEAAAAPIHHLGESIGKTAMKMPQYAPILPGGMSPKGLDTAVGQVAGSFEHNSNKKGSDAANKYFGDFMGGPKQQEINDKTLAVTTANTVEQIRDTSRSLIGSLGTVENAFNNKTALSTLADKLESKSGDLFKDPKRAEEFIKKLRSPNSKTDVYEAFKGIEENSKYGYSIFGDSTTIDRITTEGEMDKVMSMAKNSSGAAPTPQTNNSGISSPQLTSDGKSYNYMNVNIAVNNNKTGFTDTNDYKQLANNLMTLYPSGVNKSDIKNAITQMGISNADSVIDDIQNEMSKKDFFK